MDYEMPNIPGINWEEAHHYLPEKGILIAVITEFVANSKKDADRLADFRHVIEQNPSDDAYASYRIQAHAMKSNVRSLGSDLFDLAYSLEIAGRNGSRDEILRDTDEFIGKYLELSDKLKAIIGDTEKKADFDIKIFKDHIATIRAAMEAFDISTLQSSLRCIQGMDVPGSYTDKLGQLETAVRDLSSDDVIRCCNALEKMIEN